MANPSFTVNVKGSPVTFVSAFATLAEAYKALAARGNPSDFALSLLEKARARQLSPAQVAWLHKLATDARPVEALNLAPVVAMLNKAAAAQKRAPKVVLQLGEGKLVLQLSMRGSWAGVVFVHDGQQFERRVRYGSLDPNGSVHKLHAWNPEVEALLRRLAENPAAVAAQHGVATGVCCFCSTPLSTAESRSVGYGPVCAAKFNLPWGDTSVADAADAAAKKALCDNPDHVPVDGVCVHKDSPVLPAVRDSYWGEGEDGPAHGDHRTTQADDDYEDEMREHARQEREAAGSTEAQNDLFCDDRGV